MSAAEYERFTAALRRRLEADPDVLGLVALGSTADATHRDAWSDHDFWVVTRPGHQDVLLDDLSWLPGSEQILIPARHGRRHYGVLYRDGHLAEFAVFDPAEATTGTVTVYRVLFDRGTWRRPSPARGSAPPRARGTRRNARSSSTTS